MTSTATEWVRPSLFDQPTEPPPTPDPVEAAASTAGRHWVTYAAAFVHKYLTSHETMHVDDLWAAGLEPPIEPRALGSVIRHAQRSHWVRYIEAPSGVVARPSATSRGALKPVWYSLVYNIGETK